jgi:hypothetical protein
LTAGEIEIAADPGPVVAGDAAFAPAQIVGGADVGEEAEALDVAEVQASFDEARGVDDERRLAVLLLRLDEPGYAFVGQLATPRIS